MPLPTFAQTCEAIWWRLPSGLQPLLPATLIGYCLLNGFTFSFDLALLSVLHAKADLVYPVAATIAYACAFALSFVLNRRFNFRSHAPVGAQVGRFVLTAAANYLINILAIGTALVTAGVPTGPARIISGLCEAAFMYSMLRWWVFRAPG